jgi:hypothetical protein
VWAYSDESERANLMLLAVVLVPPAAVDDARTALRGLLLSGQRKLHTSDESDRRRRALLDTVARVEQLSAVVLRYRRPPGTNRVAARHALLVAATTVAVEAGVSAWTLDDLPPAQRDRDRDTIGHALQRLDARQLVYDHRRSHTEPLLWAADAVCWAAGAGGDWRRRISAILTTSDVEP